jgi:N-acetylmuramoyl-L-alanine amidase
MMILALIASAPAVVVLDPGHGGAEEGARSKDGVLEKDVALAIARAAERELEKRGVGVVLTRTDDRHVPLLSRAAVANRANAEAFVSIHANWAPVDDRRGAETYILAVHASDAIAAEALEREAASELPVEVEAKSDVDLILEDLGRTYDHESSAKLAKAIQDRIAKVAGLLPSRGLRQAPFEVLEKTRAAAVLVEVGYLSHGKQGVFLGTPAGQRAAGEAIARGILSFLGEK